MKTVLHPHEFKPITAEQYLGEYGSKHDPKWQNEERPRTRCTACLRVLRLTDESRPVFDQTFGHMPNPMEFCPFKTGTQNNYLTLGNTPKNPARGAEIRSLFFQNWPWHFELIKSYVGHVDIFDFIQRIELADKDDLWGCSNIQEWEIPYVLMVWLPFKPILTISKTSNQPLREQWVRFWYDSRVRTINDLWIEVQEPLTMIRATFTTSARAISPSNTDIDRTSREFINQDFLHWPAPRVVPFQKQKMLDRFLRE
jgi:hypothetical protein